MAANVVGDRREPTAAAAGHPPGRGRRGARGDGPARAPRRAHGRGHAVVDEPGAPAHRDACASSPRRSRRRTWWPGSCRPRPRAPDLSSAALTSARVVVGAGRGAGSRRRVRRRGRSWRSCSDGALGVSRVVTSLGWRPHHEQIGQTGSRISPERLHPVRHQRGHPALGGLRELEDDPGDQHRRERADGHQGDLRGDRRHARGRSRDQRRDPATAGLTMDFAPSIPAAEDAPWGAVLRADGPVQRGDHAAGGADAPAAAGRSWPPGTAVYLTFLPNTPWDQTLGGRALRSPRPGCARCRTSRPAPCPTAPPCAACWATLAAVGVEELLVLAGRWHPVGEFHETAQILDSGCLEEAGIRRVGVVGPPGGASRRRRRRADVGAGREEPHRPRPRPRHAPGHPVRVRGRADRGVGAAAAGDGRRRCPCTSGCPASPRPTRLLRVRPAVRRGRRRSRCCASRPAACSSSRPRAVHHPDATLLGLAAAVGGRPRQPAAAVHFFPFGALAATAEWAFDIRDGRFELVDRDRLRITA